MIAYIAAITWIAVGKLEMNDFPLVEYTFIE